eukprot:TRINITY_DN8287_c0_g1_i14.p1 TRINITY_DN8287_c0_g1~~TRINITY_DN8287_c0_g1_i14.p1  ORF type:complete len:765 (+),score=256.47 TRINITY_DN8287_c0_g1_i14:127-2421(+)
MEEPIGLEEGWKDTHDSIKKIIKIIEGGSTKDFPVEESSNAYTIVYRMCTQKNGNHTDEMYERYSASFKEYLVESVLPAVQKLEGIEMLKELVQRWKNQRQMMRYLSNIFFKYLDRYHVIRHNLDSTRIVALKCFKAHVFDPIKARVLDAVLELIHTEREAETADHRLLKAIISIFCEMGLSDKQDAPAQDGVVTSEITLSCYQDDFEKEFIEQTHKYYARKASSLSEEESFPNYMIKAETFLQNEMERVKNYLHDSSETKLLEAAEHELLEVHQERLINKDTGVIALLANHATEDMCRMFRLFSVKSLQKGQQDGLQPIGDLMCKYVIEEGNGVVDTSHEEESVNLIERLLAKYNNFAGIVKDCFESHLVFQKALKLAFETVVNRDVTVKGKPKTSAELMADYCDRVLKNAQKVDEEEINKTLESTVQLFNHLQEKDYFADFYRIQLAKRLLMSNNMREHLESETILKLKMQCGSQFTAKMAGMVQDLSTSKDFQQNFEGEYPDGKIVLEEGRDGGKPTTIAISVQVLTHGYWPTYTSPEDLAIPPEIARCMEVFTEYYSNKQTHRKLRWVHTMGKNTIEMHGFTIGGAKKAKERKEGKKGKESKIHLTVSTIQAFLLLMFNNNERLSLEDIASALGMDPKELRKYMKSLTLQKEKILLKEPEGKEINPGDVFRVNYDYSPLKNRVSIPLVVMQTDEKQVQDVHENVQQDRKLAIEACIVRVMKARVTMQHLSLIHISEPTRLLSISYAVFCLKKKKKKKNKK